MPRLSEAVLGSREIRTLSMEICGGVDVRMTMVLRCGTGLSPINSALVAQLQSSRFCDDGFCKLRRFAVGGIRPLRIESHQNVVRSSIGGVREVIERDSGCLRFPRNLAPYDDIPSIPSPACPKGNCGTARVSPYIWCNPGGI